MSKRLNRSGPNFCGTSRDHGEGLRMIKKKKCVLKTHFLLPYSIYRVIHIVWDDCRKCMLSNSSHLWFPATCFFRCLIFKYPIKDRISDRSLNLTLESTYFKCFRSSLQSHSLWNTLYVFMVRVWNICIFLARIFMISPSLFLHSWHFSTKS